VPSRQSPRTVTTDGPQTPQPAAEDLALGAPCPAAGSRLAARHDASRRRRGGWSGRRKRTGARSVKSSNRLVTRPSGQADRQGGSCSGSARPGPHPGMAHRWTAAAAHLPQGGVPRGPGRAALVAAEAWLGRRRGASIRIAPNAPSEGEECPTTIPHPSQHSRNGRGTPSVEMPASGDS